jgi:hypothetical protein
MARPKAPLYAASRNAPYDPTTAWSREDEARTNELLAARSKRFFEFLDLSLENMAGAAHVAAAQSKRYQGQVQQQRGVPPPPPQENEPPSVETIAAPPGSLTIDSSLKRSILLQFLRNPRRQTWKSAMDSMKTGQLSFLLIGRFGRMKGYSLRHINGR